jgi:acyl carrier protein
MNDPDAILPQIRQVMKAAFNVDPQTITIETKASEIPGWDSVGQLSLITELEDCFKFSLEVDDMMAMENVRDVVRIVQDKLATGA